MCCVPSPCLCVLSLVPRGSEQGVWAVLCAPLSLLVQIGVWLEVSWDLGFCCWFLVSGFTRLSAGVLFSCISLLFW